MRNCLALCSLYRCLEDGPLLLLSVLKSKAVGGKEEEFADLEIIAHFAGAERRVMTKQRFLPIVKSREQSRPPAAVIR